MCIVNEKYESVVCTCSVAYMRAEIGNENLVVCLSEYLPLRSVYHISCMSMLAIYFSLRGLCRKEITNISNRQDTMVSFMFVRSRLPR